MLFGRRRPLSLLRRVLTFLWPRGGLTRAGKYLAHRVSRLPGSAYSIAAGFACGAAVSFTPLIGFHFIMGGIIAFIIRGNQIAMALGTVVGNPWTFPFIWSWIFTLGVWMRGQEPDADLPETLSLAYIFDRPADVLYPMLLGSVPSAIVVWVLVFWPCYKAVSRYQAHRIARREKGRRRRWMPMAPAAGASVVHPPAADTPQVEQGDGQDGMTTDSTGGSDGPGASEGKETTKGDGQ